MMISLNAIGDDMWTLAWSAVAYSNQKGIPRCALTFTNESTYDLYVFNSFSRTEIPQEHRFFTQLAFHSTICVNVLQNIELTGKTHFTLNTAT